MNERGQALPWVTSLLGCLDACSSLTQGHSSLSSIILHCLIFFHFSAETLDRMRDLSCSFCSKQVLLKSCLGPESTRRDLERLFPARNLQEHIWRVGCKAGVDGEPQEASALLCAALLYGWIENNLGLVCNGILGPKEGWFPPPS